MLKSTFNCNKSNLWLKINLPRNQRIYKLSHKLSNILQTPHLKFISSGFSSKSRTPRITFFPIVQRPARKVRAYLYSHKRVRPLGTSRVRVPSNDAHTQVKQQAHCSVVHTRSVMGKEIACSSPMRFARYFPRDVYFHRRRWAACTSIANASIWKYASGLGRKINEYVWRIRRRRRRRRRLIKRNRLSRRENERGNRSGKGVARGDEKVRQGEGGEVIARNEARRKCDEK